MWDGIGDFTHFADNMIGIYRDEIVLGARGDKIITGCQWCGDAHLKLDSGRDDAFRLKSLKMAKDSTASCP